MGGMCGGEVGGCALLHNAAESPSTSARAAFGIVVKFMAQDAPRLGFLCRVTRLRLHGEVQRLASVV